MAGTVLRSGTISRTLLHEMPHADQIAVESVQDVEAIIDYNRYRYNMFDGKSRWSPVNSSKDVPIASIGMVAYMDLLRKGIIDIHGEGDEKKFNAWLNDNENQKWRCRPGRV